MFITYESYYEVANICKRVFIAVLILPRQLNCFFRGFSSHAAAKGKCSGTLLPFYPISHAKTGFGKAKFRGGKEKKRTCLGSRPQVGPKIVR